LAEHFVFVPIGLVVQALVPTPGGAGGGEWGFSKLYEVFGGSEVNGALGSLVQRVLTWVFGLAGYLVYLWMHASLSAAAARTRPSPIAVALPNGQAGAQVSSEHFTTR
jgi:hypothetical protein